MATSLSRVLNLASFLICITVAASFVLFAVNQTSTASAHQQEVLNPSTVPSTPAATSPATAGSPKSKVAHVGGVHQTIDELSNKFTSPFSGITTGSSSEWMTRGVNLLLTLAVYGFGIGFVARVLRVGL